MSANIRFLSIILLAGLATAFWGRTATAQDIGEALASGNVDLSFRYRYEFVDQDGVPDDANASTLRTRLTYKSGDFRDFSLVLEADNITQIGNDNYNSTRNGNTNRATVADPDGTEFNQAYLAYSGVSDSVFKLGRQHINRDNQRFVGGVGWRQNEQTFDGIGITNKSFEDTQLDYAYVRNVNLIFGPDSGTPPGNLDSKVHLLNAAYNGLSLGRISGYGYFMEFDDAESLSNRTFGARIAGSTNVLDDAKLGYVAEFAHQSDHGDNPNDYSANYWVAEASLEFEKVTGKVGYEVLEGDSASQGDAFMTPLATLHKFQGWADKFLTTPPGGIEDVYVAVTANVLNSKLTFVYHDFEAESGGGDYGDEIDLSFSHKFGQRYTGLLKYATYDADNFATDTDKFWLMFTASF